MNWRLCAFGIGAAILPYFVRSSIIFDYLHASAVDPKPDVRWAKALQRRCERNSASKDQTRGARCVLLLRLPMQQSALLDEGCCQSPSARMDLCVRASPRRRVVTRIGAVFSASLSTGWISFPSSATPHPCVSAEVMPGLADIHRICQNDTRRVDRQTADHTSDALSGDSRRNSPTWRRT